jgi:colicin import membrane protein
MTFQPRHLMAALVLHSALLFLVGAGVQCSPRMQRPLVISAVLLDPSRQEVARQQRADQRRLEERQKREEEARRAEQQRKAEAEAAARKKQTEAKLAADQKRAADQKKAAEQKKAQETQARREADEKARLAEAMQAEETEREIDREAMARAASAREAKLAQWAEQLTRHVKRNWNRPPSSTEDFECRVRMQLLPDGTVTNAKIEKSCGSAQLDRSVEDAVYRASPLPKPSDPSVFERDLTIRFVPK